MDQELNTWIEYILPAKPIRYMGDLYAIGDELNVHPKPYINSKWVLEYVAPHNGMIRRVYKSEKEALYTGIIIELVWRNGQRT